MKVGEAIRLRNALQDGKISDAQAIKLLKQLVDEHPGLLKIVTSVHRCHGQVLFPSGGTDPKTPREQKRCDAFQPDVKHPGHYVCNDVIAVHPVPGNPHGKWAAVSAERDHCSAKPPALLKHLLWPTLMGVE